MDHYWETIELTSRELKKYKKVAGKLSVADEYDTAHPLFVEVFTSKAYSSNFRRCLVLHLSSNRQARLWGFENLEGRDLFEMVSKVTYRPTKEFTEDEVDALSSNSAFFASAFSKEENTFNMLFISLINRRMQRTCIKVKLLEHTIKLNLMNLYLAEFVLTSNAAFYSGMTELEQLVIGWARKEYGLEDLPDSWVIRFLSSNA